MSTVNEWIDTIRGTDNDSKVASEAKMVQTTLWRQIKHGTVKPETVVKIARAYDKSPIPGLIALGLITAEDAASMQVESALTTASDQQLVNEVLRRLEEGKASELLTGPAVYLEDDSAIMIDPKE